MKEKNKGIIVAAVCAGMLSCMAANEGEIIREPLEPAEGWSPVGVAFLPVSALEWPGPKEDVDGFQLSLIGCHNHEIAGLAFASCNVWTDGDLDGLCFSGIGTWSNGARFGIHLTSVVNYAEDAMHGMQLAMFNSAYDMSGFQMGVVNCASEFHGFQCGLWNMTEDGGGLQLGVVNLAMNFSGVQIGLGNINGSSPLTACIIANVWF